MSVLQIICIVLFVAIVRGGTVLISISVLLSIGREYHEG